MVKLSVHSKFCTSSRVCIRIENRRGILAERVNYVGCDHHDGHCQGKSESPHSSGICSCPRYFGLRLFTRPQVLKEALSINKHRYEYQRPQATRLATSLG